MTTVFSFNRHPAYQYLLSFVDVEYVVCDAWPSETRPYPQNVTFVNQANLEWALAEADVWLSHLVTPDLVTYLRFAARHGFPERVVQIMHGRRERTGFIHHPLLAAGYRVAKRGLVPLLRALGRAAPVEYVFISDFVADSWPLPGTVVYPGVPRDEIVGDTRGSHDGPPLAVGNDMGRPHFRSDLLVELVERTELRVFGSNELVESEFVRWQALIEAYRDARGYVNLLQPPENAFNLATLEAMGAGCAVVTTPHPDPVLEDTAIEAETADEFVAAFDRLQDPRVRERYARAGWQLLDDRFSMRRFVDKWSDLLNG